MRRTLVQLAFAPFGEPVEVKLYPRARKPEISLVARPRSPIDSASPSSLEVAIARCERAADECEAMARSAVKARNACWAAYGASKRLRQSA